VRYLGGKARQGKKIAGFINEAAGGLLVFEPFCGALNVTQYLDGPVLASDANAALINMYQAMQGGWLPPDTLTREEYNTLKATKDPADPLTAFAGFGCSFGGKWFGGYAKGDRCTRNYAQGAQRSLVRKFAKMSTAVFRCLTFADVEGLIDKLPCVVYCDPPYANTTGYGAVGAFDTDAFWDRCERLAAKGVPVFVSEFTNPRGHEVVWSVSRGQRLQAQAKTSTLNQELLIRVGP
jgi:DNA adenine methylase